MTDVLLTAALVPARTRPAARATDHQAALLPALGTAPDRLPPRCPALDRRPGPGPLPDAAAGPYRPGHRPAGPQPKPVRYEAAAPGRPGPRRHQEAGPDPRRRRLARLWTWLDASTGAHVRPPTAQPRRSAPFTRLRLPAPRRRRPLPARLLRATPRRAQGDRRAFWIRAKAFFADAGITVPSRDDRQRRLLPLTRLRHGARRDVKHRRTRPYRPQTNGKVERFNRTLPPNGPTPRSTSQTKPAPRPTPTGSTSTITTDPTPASEASSPPTAFTTSRGTTPASDLPAVPAKHGADGCRCGLR